MKKKVMPVIAAVVLIIIVAAIGIITSIVEKYTPTDEVMSQEEYFGISGENELALIIQGNLVMDKGIVSEQIPYISISAVTGYLNDKFYWDSQDNMLLYTTPTDILKIPAEGKEYTVSGTAKTEEYTIVKVDGDQAYIAAPFVQQYTNMEYQLIENPNHLVITNEFGEVSYAEVNKDDAIRYQGGIKSPILVEVAKGEKVTVLEQMDEWSKVLTSSGYAGYIQNKRLGDIYTETTSREFTEPEYTSLRKDYKINLVWHQITNADSNYNLVYETAEMKGVNTISPTWFSISSNEGDISSLASEEYVTNAHKLGLEVWGLVDNFSEEIDTKTVLSSTAAREKLSNQLIAAAIQYDLDGINVDFEAIPEDAGADYIQFIRELSVKCRKNGFILSIDDPVPMPFTTHYDREAQGEVADYVIIMGYDEHYVGSEAGSVASLPFVRAGIEETLLEVPAEKVINAVPFYTRLWKIDQSGNTTSEAIGMDTADETLAANGVTANWSEDTSQDYAEYQDDEGNTYKIWLENEKSLEEKAKLVKEYELGGIAAWKLGFERSTVWSILQKYVSS